VGKDAALPTIGPPCEKIVQCKRVNGGNALAATFREDAVQQRRLSRSEKARQHCDGDQARRKQGLLVARGNPKKLADIDTVARSRAAGLGFVPLLWERFDLVLRSAIIFFPDPRCCSISCERPFSVIRPRGTARL